MATEEFYPGEKDDIERVLQGYRNQISQPAAIFEMLVRAIESDELNEMRDALVYCFKNSGLTRRVIL